MPVDVALTVLQGLRATMLDPRLLKALLVAGAPLRLAIAVNIWAGRSLRCGPAGCWVGAAPDATMCCGPAHLSNDMCSLWLTRVEAWREPGEGLLPRQLRCYQHPSFPSCRAIAAELARRLFELVGWLSGRVSERRLRGFERAYFALRRWHALAGAWEMGCKLVWLPSSCSGTVCGGAAAWLSAGCAGTMLWLPRLNACRATCPCHMPASAAAVPTLFSSCHRGAAGGEAGAVGGAAVDRVCLWGAAAAQAAASTNGLCDQLQSMGAGGAGGEAAGLLVGKAQKGDTSLPN